MTMMVTLSDGNGARVCVNRPVTLDDPQADVAAIIADLGYPGWSIAAEHDGPPPEDGVIVDGAWIVPLAVLQARAIAGVNAIRAERKAAGCTVPGVGAVQTDEVSTQNITGLVVMAQVAIANAQQFSEPFTLADNSVVTLDGPGMIGMGVAVGQYVAAVYARGRALRDAINAAMTADELSAIDITAGWP